MASGDVRCTTPTAYGRRQALLTSRASTVGDDLQVVKQDQLIKCDPSDYKRRRTIAIQRAHGRSCGFTLQSYGLHHKRQQQTELLTYVDHVEHSGPAHHAGLRPGDVILSINGVSMEKADHSTLVSFIRNSGNILRMVVLFDDCCHKIELRFRQIKLQQVLAEKIQQLKELEVQESLIMKGLSARYNDTDMDDCASSSDDSSVWSSRCSSPHVFDSESSFHSPDGSSTSPFCSLDSRGLDSMDAVEQLPGGHHSRSHYFSSSLSPVSYDCSSLPTHVRRKKHPRILQTALARAAVGLMSTPRRSTSPPHHKMSHSMDEANMKKQQVSCSSPEAATGGPVLQRNSRSLSEISERRMTTGGDDLERRRGGRGGGSLVSHVRQSFQQHRVDRRRRRVAKHVVTPDSTQPQLVSLRQFCDDYRTCCLQQNLSARRRSLDRMLSTDDLVTDNDDDHGVVLLNAPANHRDSSAAIDNSPVQRLGNLPEESCLPSAAGEVDHSLPVPLTVITDDHVVVQGASSIVTHPQEFSIQWLSGLPEESCPSSSSVPAVVSSTVGQVNVSPPVFTVLVTDSNQLSSEDRCPPVVRPTEPTDDHSATFTAEACSADVRLCDNNSGLADSVDSSTTMMSVISATNTEDDEEGTTSPRPYYNDCSAERHGTSPVLGEVKQDPFFQLVNRGSQATHNQSIDAHGHVYTSPTQTTHSAVVERIAYDPQTGSVTIQQYDDDVSSTAAEQHHQVLQSSMSYGDEVYADWNANTSANDVRPVGASSTDNPMNFSQKCEFTVNSSRPGLVENAGIVTDAPMKGRSAAASMASVAENMAEINDETCIPESETTSAESQPQQQAVPTDTRLLILNNKDEETWL